MTIALRDLLTLFSLAVAIVIGVGVAVTYFGSRFRKASDELQKGYIAGLERDRRELQTENKELRDEVAELRGAVRVLREMVMGRCRSFAVDPVTGGCTHCGLGLAYGQRTRAENGKERV
jgi:cell division protein FtsB